MIDLFKAVPPGGILSYVVVLIVGSQGSLGGHPVIFRQEIHQFVFRWRWPLVLAGTGLAWGIPALQR